MGDRYVVKLPVPDGYQWYDIIDTQSEVMPNWAMVTMHKDLPKVGELATYVCAQLNSIHKKPFDPEGLR